MYFENLGTVSHLKAVSFSTHATEISNCLLSLQHIAEGNMLTYIYRAQLALATSVLFCFLFIWFIEPSVFPSLSTIVLNFFFSTVKRQVPGFSMYNIV